MQHQLSSRVDRNDKWRSLTGSFKKFLDFSRLIYFK